MIGLASFFALTASLGALLEIIDTSIVNVALRDMQATLGATLSEIGWVVTGYAIANVIIIPLSAWLGDYFGKKNYFVFSLIGFVIASMLCGMSNSLPMLIVADASVDTDGRVRVQLTREDVPITRRLRFGFMVNTDKEYMAGFRYIVTKNFAFSTHYDSDMGLGAGITLSY